MYNVSLNFYIFNNKKRTGGKSEYWCARWAQWYQPHFLSFKFLQNLNPKITILKCQVHKKMLAQWIHHSANLCQLVGLRFQILQLWLNNRIAKQKLSNIYTWPELKASHIYRHQSQELRHTRLVSLRLLKLIKLSFLWGW